MVISGTLSTILEENIIWQRISRRQVIPWQFENVKATRYLIWADKITQAKWCKKWTFSPYFGSHCQRCCLGWGFFSWTTTPLPHSSSHNKDLLFSPLLAAININIPSLLISFKIGSLVYSYLQINSLSKKFQYGFYEYEEYILSNAEANDSLYPIIFNLPLSKSQYSLNVDAPELWLG